MWLISGRDPRARSKELAGKQVPSAFTKVESTLDPKIGRKIDLLDGILKPMSLKGARDRRISVKFL